MAIVINGSGTVTGLAVGGLPDGTVDDGTVASGIASSKLTGALPAISGASLTGFTDAQMPAGSVIQVVAASYASATATTSSSLADTGVTATITPSATTSKILVIVGINGNTTTATNNYMRLLLLRGTSSLINIETQTGFTSSTAKMAVSGSSSTYLDSPSTTSATTYKVQFSNPSATGTVYICDGGGTATITLMEIAG